MLLVESGTLTGFTFCKAEKHKQRENCFVTVVTMCSTCINIFVKQRHTLDSLLLVAVVVQKDVCALLCAVCASLNPPLPPCSALLCSL